MVLALVVIGPERLPEVARKLGQMVAQFRQMSEELTRELAVQLDEETQALKEAPKPDQTAITAYQPESPVGENAPALPISDETNEPAHEPEIALLPVPTEPSVRRRSHRLPLWSECATGVLEEPNQTNSQSSIEPKVVAKRSHRRPVYVPTLPVEIIQYEQPGSPLNPTESISPAKVKRPRRKTTAVPEAVSVAISPETRTPESNQTSEAIV
jgi:sec-independent protein translocase protein TatB